MKKKRSEVRKRTEYIRARVTPEEKQRFLDRCERSGMSTGDYIRVKVLNEKPLRVVRRITINRELLISLIGQLGRYGNSLNQIARKLNQGQKARRKDILEIRKGLDFLRQTCSTIRQLLGYDS